MLTEMNEGPSGARRGETRRVTSFRHLVLAGMVFAILSIAQAPYASAHAFLLRSTPADGSTLSQAPASMTLTFDEDILLRAGSVTLRSADGSIVLRTGAPSGSSAVSGLAGRQLVVSLPALDVGAYSATWSVRSADDLHLTTGTVSFAIGQSFIAHAVDRRGPPPQVLSSWLRWLDVTGIALLLGAFLLMVTLVPRSQTSPAQTAALRTLLWRVVTLMAGVELLMGVVILIDSAGLRDVLAVLTSARLGRLWLIREAGFAAAALSSFLAMGRKGPARLSLIATITLTLGSLAAIAGSSHVGVGTDRPFALLLLLVHLSVAGAWAGAVLLLLLFLVLERARGDRFLTRPILRSFAAPAACCVAVVSATGMALAARQVASVDALLTTAYGQILMVKVFAVLMAGLLGLRTAIRVRRPRSAGNHSLTRGVALESVALLVALAAAGALSVGTPSRGPAFMPSRTSEPTVVSAQLGDLLESATLAPNTVGQSWLRVDVNQTRRPALAPVTNVTASLVGPDIPASAMNSLARTEIANRWELGGVNLTAAGTWGLTITVQRAGRLDTVWHTRATVADNPAVARQPLISDRPWEPVLNHLALVLAMLTLAAGSIALGIRRKRLPRVPNRPDHTMQSEEWTLVKQ